jgi:hypothetical protein
MVVRLCVMRIREIWILLSQPFLGQIQLEALGISRYHVNAKQGCERDMHVAITVSRRLYTVESTLDLKVARQ